MLVALMVLRYTSGMETIVRDVRDLLESERSAAEQLGWRFDVQVGESDGVSTFRSGMSESRPATELAKRARWGTSIEICKPP